MITVLGATGHTGRRVAEQLLARGERIRAVARDAGKLRPLAERGAETLAGEVTDAAFLGRAFAGAEAAYTLLPPDPRVEDFRAFQDRAGEATARALRGSGIRHVTFLSSQGADLPAGTGPIAGLHAQEERLRALGTNVLDLRAAGEAYPRMPSARSQDSTSPSASGRCSRWTNRP